MSTKRVAENIRVATVVVFWKLIMRNEAVVYDSGDFSFSKPAYVEFNGRDLFTDLVERSQ